MSLTLNLAEQLISRPSVTPEDAGCLQLLTERLQPLGFVCEPMDSGPAEFRVQNLWSKRPVAPAQQAHILHALLPKAHGLSQRQIELLAAPPLPAHARISRLVVHKNLREMMAYDDSGQNYSKLTP